METRKIQKVNDTKRWFFWKVNQSDKPLARLRKDSKLKDQNHYNWHHRNNKIIIDYYEQLYANKFENLEEMDKSPNTYIIPRPNHEVIRKPE
jgi:deoxyadenosine/deoxycytidine kinase